MIAHLPEGADTFSEKGQYDCPTCSIPVKFIYPVHFTDHLGGAPHRRRIERFLAYLKSFFSASPSHMAPSQICQICVKVLRFDQTMDIHVRSKSHKNAVKAREPSQIHSVSVEMAQTEPATFRDNLEQFKRNNPDYWQYNDINVR
jgi:hypothetical protein